MLYEVITQPWLARLERLHRQTDRPIVITEIGYRSVDGAALHPYAFGDAAAIVVGLPMVGA